jgi:hypothetical protein
LYSRTLYLSRPTTRTSFQPGLRRYDMNRISQVLGGKNWTFQKKQMQTTGKPTYVPLWDRMEGARLWTLAVIRL